MNTSWKSMSPDAVPGFCGAQLEAVPNYSVAHLILGLAYEQKKDFSRAIPELKRAIELSGDKVVLPAFVAHVYALSGNTREARKILEELKQPSGKSMWTHGGLP